MKTHHVQDCKELQLQRHLCWLLVVLHWPGHSEEFVVSAQLQVTQNILVVALCPIVIYSRFFFFFFTCKNLIQFEYGQYDKDQSFFFL